MAKKLKKVESVSPETQVTPAVPEKAETIVDFNIKLHRIGRIWNTIGLALLILVPIVGMIYYKVTPDFRVLLDGGMISIILVNFLSCLAEPVIYAPILGTNGEYLAFITGNLSNLKIPCVVKAHEIVPTEQGSEEHELVSTIAVAVSSLVTVVVIAAVVIAIIITNTVASATGGKSLIDYINENPFLTPAFGCVVYALFGSLGGKYIVKNPKMALIPGAILVLISIVMALLGSNLGSTSLIVGIAMCAIFAVFSFMREKKKAKRKEEERRLAAIATGVSYEKICEIEYYQRQDEEEAALQAKLAKKATKKK